MQYIKIYGLHRSGTNYLKCMIEANFNRVRVLQNIGGTKHNRINFSHQTDFTQVESDLTIGELSTINRLFAAKKIPYVMIYKHPAAWLKSYARYKKLTINNEYIETHMGMYNMLNHHWDIHCHAVNYHNLVEAPLPELKIMAGKYNLQITGDNPVIINKITNRGGDTAYGQIITDKTFSNQYYRQKQFLHEFSVEQRKLIDNLDTFYNRKMC